MLNHDGKHIFNTKELAEKVKLKDLELRIKLIEAGQKLREVIGHKVWCERKPSCTCGAASEQAEAVANWDKLIEEYNGKKQN